MTAEEPKLFGYYDFGDGAGPVHSYRHRNPDGSIGGWVADTASTAPDAHIGPDALDRNPHNPNTSTD